MKVSGLLPRTSLITFVNLHFLPILFDDSVANAPSEKKDDSVIPSHNPSPILSPLPLSVITRDQIYEILRSWKVK